MSIFVVCGSLSNFPHPRPLSGETCLEDVCCGGGGGHLKKKTLKGGGRKNSPQNPNRGFFPRAPPPPDIPQTCFSRDGAGVGKV